MASSSSSFQCEPIFDSSAISESFSAEADAVSALVSQPAGISRECNKRRTWEPQGGKIGVRARRSPRAKQTANVEVCQLGRDPYPAGSRSDLGGWAGPTPIA